MATATLSAGALRSRPSAAEARARASRPLWRRFPYESSLLFVVALAVYVAAGAYSVLVLHHMDGDAYSRVANAYFVEFSRDKHMAAIGFIWPPLPTLFDMPIIAFKSLFPELVTLGFAGSLEAAIFSAATVVVLNGAYRRAGVWLPLRLLLALAWLANPMILIYGTMGMSEAMFDFFVVSSIVVFYRWTIEGAQRDLALTGLLAGLGVLVRWEMIFVAILLGGGILLKSVRDLRPWREIETVVLLDALPVVFLFLLWIGATAVIMHDPLFVFHSAYAVGQISATNGFGVAPDSPLTSWPGATSYILKEAFALFPAAVPLAGLLAARMLGMRDRIGSIIVMALAVPVFAFDIYSLHHAALALVIRYQIYIIPYAFLLGVVLITDVARSSKVAAQAMSLGVLALLAASDVFTLQTVSDPVMAPSEAPIVAEARNNVSEDLVSSDSKIAEGRTIAQKVAELDTDGGLILADSFRAGPVILNAPDPELYVITSDEDFEPSVAAPAIFHIGYILVPEPSDEGSLDYINRQYPTLWRDGAGIAKLVADLGSGDHWKLYKVNAHR